MDDVATQGRGVGLELGYKRNSVYFEVLGTGSEEGRVVGLVVGGDVGEGTFRGIEFGVEGKDS